MRRDKRHDGIDVSNWEGDINFRKVRKSGIRIVYIKATQGRDITDPDFERNYRKQNARNCALDFITMSQLEIWKKPRRRPLSSMTVSKISGSMPGLPWILKNLDLCPHRRYGTSPSSFCGNWRQGRGTAQPFTVTRPMHRLSLKMSGCGSILSGLHNME